MKTFFVLKNKNEIFGFFTTRSKAALGYGQISVDARKISEKARKLALKGLKIEEYEYNGPLSYEELIQKYSIQ